MTGMIELICVDVDGTLVGSSGGVTEAVWKAVERARAAGARLAVCSGRPAFGQTRELAEHLDPGGWHVFQNGASIVHLPTGGSRSACIPRPAVLDLVARARATGRILELYTDFDYAVESTHDRAVRHAGLLGVPFRPRDLLSLPGEIVRMQWLLAQGEEHAILAEPHDGLALTPSTSPVMPDTAYVSVTAPGIDKSVGVRAVAEAHGIPLARVMMVGDSGNDMEAMRIVGFPVAMGNAEPEILALAPHRVPSVDDDGLAAALELAIRL
jgi:Cof subfamily protein (haloacid dehalogenase superfamily)